MICCSFVGFHIQLEISDWVKSRDCDQVPLRTFSWVSGPQGNAGEADCHDVILRFWKHISGERPMCNSHGTRPPSFNLPDISRSLCFCSEVLAVSRTRVQDVNGLQLLSIHPGYSKFFTPHLCHFLPIYPSLYKATPTMIPGRSLKHVADDMSWASKEHLRLLKHWFAASV